MSHWHAPAPVRHACLPSSPLAPPPAPGRPSGSRNAPFSAAGAVWGSHPHRCHTSAWCHACSPPAILEPSLAVARVASSSLAPHPTPVLYPFFDHCAPVGQLGCPDHLTGGIVDQSQAGRLRTRINLEAQGMHGRCISCCFEQDGEGIASVDGGLARFQQEPCPAWMHRV
jgi:hypothetical protein